MDLSIIIVSYNTANLLARCLKSIFRSQTKLQFEVIVVDNASQDNTPALVKKQFPQVKIIRNQDNRGFGAANNQGAHQAAGDYLLFLNSDTQVSPNTLDRFLTQAKRNRANLATCCLVNPDGTLQPQGGALPNLLNLKAWMCFLDDIPGVNRLFVPYQQRNQLYFKHRQHPGWVSGTALLIKHAVFDLIGGFDEAIFMYAEDIDLCLRARHLGYRIDYFPTPHIIHQGQGSATPKNAFLGEYQGLMYLYNKHYPAWQLPLLKVILWSGAIMRSFLFGVILGQHEKAAIYIKAARLARS